MSDVPINSKRPLSSLPAAFNRRQIRNSPQEFPKITYSVLYQSKDQSIRIGAAPGKFKRVLKDDFENIFVKRFGLTHVVSILTDNEYKSLDMDQLEYKALMRQHRMKWYPVKNIVDGSVPVSDNERERFFGLVDRVAEEFVLSVRDGTPFHLLVHCRLGKHRSGVFCCCLLMRISGFLQQQIEKGSGDSLVTPPPLRTANESISYLRSKRDSKCISRLPQEELVQSFEKWNRKRNK